MVKGNGTRVSSVVRGHLGVRIERCHCHFHCLSSYFDLVPIWFCNIFCYEPRIKDHIKWEYDNILYRVSSATVNRNVLQVPSHESWHFSNNLWLHHTEYCAIFVQSLWQCANIIHCLGYFEKPFWYKWNHQELPSCEILNHKQRSLYSNEVKHWIWLVLNSSILA